MARDGSGGDVVIAGRQFCEANLEGKPKSKEEALEALERVMGTEGGGGGGTDASRRPCRLLIVTWGSFGACAAFHAASFRPAGDELQEPREGGAGGGRGGGRGGRGGQGSSSAAAAAAATTGVSAAGAPTFDARVSYEPKPVEPSEVVDSVGAGDSFNAALILGILDIVRDNKEQKEGVARALRRACEVGRKKCLVEGFAGLGW